MIPGGIILHNHFEGHFNSVNVNPKGLSAVDLLGEDCSVKLKMFILFVC